MLPLVTLGLAHVFLRSRIWK